MGRTSWQRLRQIRNVIGTAGQGQGSCDVFDARTRPSDRRNPSKSGPRIQMPDELSMHNEEFHSLNEATPPDPRIVTCPRCQTRNPADRLACWRCRLELDPATAEVPARESLRSLPIGMAAFAAPRRIMADEPAAEPHSPCRRSATTLPCLPSRPTCVSPCSAPPSRWSQRVPISRLKAGSARAPHHA